MFKNPNINKSCCTLHHTPHQHYHCDLMRDFDPSDPANKNRTFEKMVDAANRKHLNPGEQSFHYYIDVDNKVHGFIAIGNISDRLPHIIIADTGSDVSLFSHINDIHEKITEIYEHGTDGVENVKAIEELKKQMQELTDLVNSLDMDSIKAELDSFKEAYDPENIKKEILDAVSDVKDDIKTEITEDVKTTVDNIKTELESSVNDTVNTTVDNKLEEVKTELNNNVDTAIDNAIENKVSDIVTDKVTEELNNKLDDQVSTKVDDKLNEVLGEDTLNALDIISKDPESLKEWVDNKEEIIKTVEVVKEMQNTNTEMPWYSVEDILGS